MSASRLLPQRGVTLVEALVALLIMGFGMLAMVGLQGQIRRGVDLAKQRNEATRLAQQDMEQLHSYSLLDSPPVATPDVLAYADIAAKTAASIGSEVSNTTFALSRSVVDIAEPPRKAVRVRVSWLDRAGAQQWVQLDGFVAAADPSLSGVIMQPPEGNPTRQPGRHQAIPAPAKDLGDGRSVFKPPALASGVAWVFDNRSGVIAKRCTGLSPSASSADLTLADVAGACTADVNALLLSGYVRFSTGGTPDPEQPNSPALPLNMGLTTTADAGPVPSFECFDDAPAAADATRTAGVRYYCAVTPFTRTPPSWDGRLIVLDLPLGGSDYKVCRYSADYDGDTRTSNAEHPLDYKKVETALTRQNFLVVGAAQTCPAGHRVDPSLGHFFDSATIEHQPDPH